MNFNYRDFFTNNDDTHIIKEQLSITNEATKKIPVDIERIKKMYLDDKMSLDKIAKELGVSPTIIHNRLKTNNIDRRGPSITRTIPLDTERIKKMYLDDKMTVDQIAKELGVSRSTIIQRLQTSDIDRRHRHYKVKSSNVVNFTPNDLERIKKMYLHDKMAAGNIAKELKVSRVEILSQLKKMNVDVKPKSHYSSIKRFANAPHQSQSIRRLINPSHFTDNDKQPQQTPNNNIHEIPIVKIKTLLDILNDPETDDVTYDHAHNQLEHYVNKILSNIDIYVNSSLLTYFDKNTLDVEALSKLYINIQVNTSYLNVLLKNGYDNAQNIRIVLTLLTEMTENIKKLYQHFKRINTIEKAFGSDLENPS